MKKVLILWNVLIRNGLALLNLLWHQTNFWTKNLDVWCKIRPSIYFNRSPEYFTVGWCSFSSSPGERLGLEEIFVTASFTGSLLPSQSPEGSQVRPDQGWVPGAELSQLYRWAVSLWSQRKCFISLAVFFWVCSRGQLRGHGAGPQAPKSPVLVLMLYCHCLEILNFWTRALHFHFAPGAANCVASSVCSNKTKHFLPFSLVLFFFLWGSHFKYIVQSLARNVPVPGQHPHFSHVSKFFFFFSSEGRPSLVTRVLSWRGALLTTCPYTNLITSPLYHQERKIRFPDAHITVIRTLQKPTTKASACQVVLMSWSSWQKWISEWSFPC